MYGRPSVPGSPFLVSATVSHAAVFSPISGSDGRAPPPQLGVQRNLDDDEAEANEAAAEAAADDAAEAAAAAPNAGMTTAAPAIAPTANAEPLRIFLPQIIFLVISLYL